jgi:hypothetical protein
MVSSQISLSLCIEIPAGRLTIFVTTADKIVNDIKNVLIYLGYSPKDVQS